MGRYPNWTKRKNKFGNKLTVVDNITFHSQAEADRYRELKLLQNCKEIFELQLQPRFRFEVEGNHICDYVADFQYFEMGVGSRLMITVEDVKGKKTKDYIIKAKLFQALYSHINFVEIEA